MTELAANGSGAGRWFRLKKLAHAIGVQKRQTKAAPKRDAHADYWQVCNHRSPSPTTSIRK